VKFFENEKAGPQTAIFILLLFFTIFVVSTVDSPKDGPGILKEITMTGSECQDKIEIEKKNSFNEGFYRAFEITLSPQFQQKENPNDEAR
jgi:hypothetical protein